MSPLAIISLLICLSASNILADDPNDPAKQPVPISSIPKPWFMIPVNPNHQAVSLYGDGSEEMKSQEMSLPVWALHSIYIYTLSPVLEILSSLSSIILAPVKLILLPITLPFSLVSGLFSSIFGALLGGGDDENNDSSSRRRRAIMDTVQLPFTFIYDTVLAPIRIIRSILEALLSPFMTIYYWIFPESNHNHIDSIMTIRLKSVSSGLGQEVDEPAKSIGLLDNLNNSTRNFVITLGLSGWDVMKKNLFPYVDKFLETYQDSEMLPEEVKNFLRSIHSIYRMAHMLDMI